MTSGRPYLTKGQIQAIVDRLGQPEATVALGAFFDSYRLTLTSDDLRELYDRDYFNRIANHPVAELVGGTYPVNIYAVEAFRYLRGRVAGRDLLDFGCGHGDVALAVAAVGARRVVGVDTDEQLVAAARARIPAGRDVMFLTLDEFGEAELEPFDFVLLADVTEHLGDAELRELLETIRRVLRPDGEIVIHTPNGLCLANRTDTTIASRLLMLYKRLLGWRGYERDVDQLYYEQVHINVKSARQLAALLGEFGFRCDVRYDEPRRLLSGQRSGNMTVIATRR